MLRSKARKKRNYRSVFARRLCGPIKISGYRAGVVSINKEKAGELKRQMEEIAAASNLKGIKFLRSPAPGRVVSHTGTVDILSADRSSGHASGFDESIIDELGLLKERDRELVNGMRSAISARNGRFLALSIHGDAPFTAEMINRWKNGDEGIAVHLYQAPEDCDLNDETAWHLANPGLKSGIKAIEYMRDEARRVISTPADQGSFRAFDLNLPQDPSREMICSVQDWKAILRDENDLPPRDGVCTVGFDFGGSRSMTCLAAFWPGTMRLELWGAFPATPDLKERGIQDGVGGRYLQMRERGELSIYSGRVTPVGEFLKDCTERLSGERVLIAGADRYKSEEAIQALESADIKWRMEWRGVGKGKTADGSHDVRAFQNRVLAGRLFMSPSLIMVSAITDSSIIRDEYDNPSLNKARARSRIDALQAAVITIGLADIHANKPKRKGWRYRGVAAA